MYHLFHYRYEESMEHCHKRSSVESVFSMLKAKLSRVLAKVLCHNICVLIRATHDSGTEATLCSETPPEPKLLL